MTTPHTLARALALVAALGLLARADAQQIGGGGGGGSGSVTYPLTAPNGSVSAPSYGFSGGTSSGVFAPANGNVEIVGSNGASATGGSVTLAGGAPSGGNNNGGGATISSAAATGTGVPGNISIAGGNLSSTASNLQSAGSVTITGGNDGGGSGNVITGGSVTIQGGASSGSTNAAGGNVVVQGGNATASTGAGGNVTIAAGTIPSSDTNCGNINCNIYLTPSGPSAGGAAAGSVIIAAGDGSGTFHPGGSINVAIASTGNGADTTEDTLQTYSLPANSLDRNGRCVRVTSWGTLAANGDTKTIRVYFGASVISSGGLTSSGVAWLAHLVVCKTGASTQSVIGDMLVGTTAITPYSNAGTDTDTSAITLKTTGQAGTANANDVVGKGQLVEFLS